MPALRSCVEPILTAEYELVGYRAIGKVPQYSGAIEQVRGTLEPCGFRFAVTEITRCLSATASRDRASADMQALIQSMAQDIENYPADVVSTVLTEWRQTQKWWPIGSEIRSRCEKLAKPRRDLLGILEGDMPRLERAVSLADLALNFDREKRSENLARLLAKPRAEIAPRPMRERRKVRPHHLPPEHGLAYTEARNAHKSPAEAQEMADAVLMEGT
jgi:hypothetical protein